LGCLALTGLRIAEIAGARIAVGVGTLLERSEAYTKLTDIVDRTGEVVVAGRPVAFGVGKTEERKAGRHLLARTASAVAARPGRRRRAGAGAASASVVDRARIAVIATAAGAWGALALVADTHVVLGAAVEVVALLRDSRRGESEGKKNRE